MQTLESKIRAVLSEHEPMTEREKSLSAALKQTLQSGLSQQGGCGGPDYYSGQAGGGDGGNTQHSESVGGSGFGGVGTLGNTHCVTT